MASFWNGKRALVTGGAGLIGSYLAELLLQDGSKVRVVDNLENGSLQNLASCINEIEFLQADLHDPGVCRRAVDGVDVVLHLAAKTVGILHSMHHHGEMLSDGLLISTLLLEAARKEGIKRFLMVSSSCVYPDDSPIPIPEDAADRNSPEKANEGYGWAKRMAEIQAGYYAREYDMEIAIVRIANAYGPRYHWNHGEANVIPALIRRILSGENPLVVWGSGKQTRNFIHARDCAKAMQLATELAASCVPINLATTEETSMATLASLLTSVAGYQGKVIFDTNKPEGPRRKVLDVGRLTKLIPEFRPTISLSEGLEETVVAAQTLGVRLLA